MFPGKTYAAIGLAAIASSGVSIGASFILSTAAIAQSTAQPYGSHMWEGGWHGWFFGPVMMLLFIAVAVAVVILLVRWLGGAGHGIGHAGHGHSTTPHGPGGTTPLDILKERVARGEIDSDEFRERRSVLRE